MEAQDENGQTWHSYAVFAADEAGIVDVREQAPLSGTYGSADGFGLFWSMRSSSGAATPAYRLRKPFQWKMRAFVGEPGPDAGPKDFAQLQAVDEAVITRWFVAPDVERFDVREDGLYGTLFLPPGKEELPALITLGGSEGGLDELIAGVFASFGFATLALAYFGMKPLPKQLREIPLEYFQQAIEWLQRHPRVDGQRIGVMGSSRGGELALLLGVTFPSVRAVVADAPSSVVGSAVSLASRSAWTKGGKPLPFLANPGALYKLLWQLVKWIFVRKPFAPGASLTIDAIDPAELGRVSIRVENVNGPILLVSGEDDQMWPAYRFGQLVTERLEKHNFPHEYEHLHYPDAGHLAYFLPDIPACNSTATPLFVMGGTIEGNARARADAWPRVLDFLRRHLMKSEAARRVT